MLTVWRFNKQGQLADLAYVENEIRARLAIARRQHALDSLIQRLRSRHAVELLMSEDADLTPVDTLR